MKGKLIQNGIWWVRVREEDRRTQTLGEYLAGLFTVAVVIGSAVLLLMALSQILKGEEFEAYQSTSPDMGVAVAYEIKISEYKPPTSLIFHGTKNTQIGMLKWESEGVFTFEGEAEESAQVFFDHFRRMGLEYCKEERE